MTPGSLGDSPVAVFQCVCVVLSLHFRWLFKMDSPFKTALQSTSDATDTIDTVRTPLHLPQGRGTSPRGHMPSDSARRVFHVASWR